MKKFVFLTVIITILIAQACKKEEVSTDCGVAANLSLGIKDTFIVSSSGGFAGGGLGTFKIINKQLFVVKGTKDSLLSNEKFLKADSLVSIFPKEIKTNPNKNWVGYCPDIFVFGVELHFSNGTIEKWSYDSCDKNTPDYAKCYFSEVIKTLYTP